MSHRVQHFGSEDAVCVAGPTAPGPPVLAQQETAHHVQLWGTQQAALLCGRRAQDRPPGPDAVPGTGTRPPPGHRR